jgi:hypothetical protein
MHGGDEIFIKNFGWQLDGKKPLGRSRYRRKNTIKVDLEKNGVKM